MTRGPQVWHMSDIAELKLVVSWDAAYYHAPATSTGPEERDEELEIDKVILDGRVLTAEEQAKIEDLLISIIKEREEVD